MSEHLPECWKNLCETCDSDACPPCICTPLRACEQRVLHKEYLLDQGDPYREVYRGGYSAGLDAAVAAVAAIPAPHYCDEDWHNAIGEALIAIRALKEKP